MNRFLSLLAIFFLVLAFGAWSWRRALFGTPVAPQAAHVERGKYLVEEVAKCPECHTPRDAAGKLRSEAWLQGGPIWITPVAPIPNWADQTPPLAGMGSFTDEQMERVLEQGVGPERETLRPPMHLYHMNREDARAIIAYLRSLPPGHR